MYRFTVEYYFEKYHTGSVNYENTRTAVVISDTLLNAIDKIRQVDEAYIETSSVKFEEEVHYEP